jgi:hypothetical protein
LPTKTDGKRNIWTRMGYMKKRGNLAEKEKKNTVN